MKTPHAVLIGFSLIAEAIFFKDTVRAFTFVKDAHAAGSGNNVSTKCYLDRMEDVRRERSGTALAYYGSAKHN